MASGCTSNGTHLASDCLQPTSDKCVKYTGVPIPKLGICTGDTLAEVEAVLLDKILQFSQGLGIMIPDIDFTTCDLFTTYVTCCNGPGTVSKELAGLIKIIFETLCTLDTRLTVVEGQIDDLFTGPYFTSCLAGITTNSTFKEIIQALLIKVCGHDTRITALETAITNINSTLGTTIGNFLLSHINSCQSGCLVKSGSGSTANIQLLGFAPIGTIMAFDGDLSMFDANGVGRTGTSACGWALCNGYNGLTPNMNGVGIMGTTTMGGSVNAAADGGTYSHGSTGGKKEVTLTSAQIPATSFSGSTVAGSGSIGYYKVSRQHAGTGDNTMGYQCDGSGTSTPCPSAPNGSINFTVPSQTISGSTGGGGGSHENRSPYIALEWIKRIA